MLDMIEDTIEAIAKKSNTTTATHPNPQQ